MSGPYKIVLFDDSSQRISIVKHRVVFCRHGDAYTNPGESVDRPSNGG